MTASDLPDGKLKTSQFAVSNVEYQISEIGRVEKCRVKFSDMDSLGKLACALITERARYAPAADERGKAVRSRDMMVVEWGAPPAITVAGVVDYGGALPTTPPEIWMADTRIGRLGVRRPGTAFFRFRIGANGRVGECVAAALQGTIEDGKYVCTRFQENARFRSPVDEQGKPYETIATVKWGWSRSGRRPANAW